MPRVAGTLITVAILTGACAGSAPALSASAAPTSTAPWTPSPSVAESTAPTGIDLSAVPTACINLGMDDCRRVTAEVAALVPVGTVPTYVQVGPFGCPEGGGCARSLVARPQGDVTIEAGAASIAYHVTVATGGGNLTIERQDPFLMPLEPTSQPPVTPGVRRFTLGHCGLVERDRCRRQLVGSDRGDRWRPPERHQLCRRHARHPRPRSCDVHLGHGLHGPARAARWAEGVPGLHVTARERR